MLKKCDIENLYWIECLEKIMEFGNYRMIIQDDLDGLLNKLKGHKIGAKLKKYLGQPD